NSRSAPARRRRCWCRAPGAACLDLARQPVDAGKVRPVDLDADRRADAGRQHVDARLDRHGPGVADARELQRLVHSAVSESTVTPGRHWSSGFRLMMVSNISTGAGSVAVAARPALPNTLATSGKPLMMRSEVCSSSAALVTDMPGTLTGIYISVPSFSVGINSEPSR